MAAPFDGVKHSGFGHSGGPEGIDEYLITRYVTVPEVVEGPALADVEPRQWP